MTFLCSREHPSSHFQLVLDEKGQECMQKHVADVGVTATGLVMSVPQCLEGAGLSHLAWHGSVDTSFECCPSPRVLFARHLKGVFV